MTGALEIKVTISEIATPTLFDALVAVSNPRKRAALLKRLADDALRGSVPVLHAGVTPTPTSANTSATTEAAIGSARSESPVAPKQIAPVRDDQPDFDYAFLAENLNVG
ncbi:MULTISPECIES: hypothetical protein [unclassified Caballeronia]|jgi:hypothetical protein|uniref:hypothetical protein n=1 Tax=unclassified Caballeronia TaxID=2646786 RepID=UPI00117DB60A|nr:MULTISPECIES: hypothetical protein [unclassified Caballeronia]